MTCNEQNDANFIDKVSHIIGESELSATTSKETPNLDVENLESDDISVICYTSGTTGRSYILKNTP